jgi:hypothetical protein
MTEPGSTEIGPTNNSPGSSLKRFKARQEFHHSSEGQFVSTIRETETHLKARDEKAATEAKNAPDVIEKRSFLGIPLATVRKWFKK